MSERAAATALRSTVINRPEARTAQSFGLRPLRAASPTNQPHMWRLATIRVNEAV